MENERHIPFRLGDDPRGNYWAVLDTVEQRYIRTWRKGLTALVWRSNESEATEMADLLNKWNMGNIAVVKRELSKSQIGMYANKARKKTKKESAMAAFKRCATCGTMYKTEGEHCE